MTAKTCTRCGITKTLDAFSVKVGGKHGRASHCKECRAAENRRRRVNYADQPDWQPAAEKVCPRCEQLLPAAAFTPNKMTKSGLNSWCRECERVRRRAQYASDPERWKFEADRWRRANPEKDRIGRRNGRLRRQYGITSAQYDQMLAAQDGKCAICGTTDPGPVRVGQPAFRVDHCHKSGAIRGLLCHNCNSGMGLLGDSTERLEAAAAYLRRREPAMT